MRKVFSILTLTSALVLSGCSGGGSNTSKKDTTPAATDNTTPAKGDATHVISGDLTLHGTTKPVSIPMKVTTTDDTLTLDGTFTIDRTQFGITGGAGQVNNEVTIKVSAKVPRKGDNAGAITPENTKIDFIGTKKGGKHDGGFKSFTGSIKPADGDLTKSTITLEIDIDSIWTDDDQQMKKLTPHLKSPDFFDAKKYPKASFTSKEIKAEK